MARWRLFGKPKEVDVTEEKKTVEDEPLAEHRETLYTGVSTSKKTRATASSDQRIWRDVGAVEREIDGLHITKSKSSSDVDKTVDKLIAKRKKK